MLDSINRFFSTFSQNIRIVDLLDVGLVALLLYGGITLLRRGLSRRAQKSVVVSTATLVTVYVLAGLLGLYLVEMAIEVLFVVLVVGVIVVFQSDIRRLIGHIGNWSLTGSSSSSDLSNTTVNTLVEATRKMAETKTGALIAIRGAEAWDRHITGGVSLEGVASQPLLESLFNTAAPAHDGAVLMEGDEITKFAAHLPLSTELTDSKYGTRHAAGLGLSERCDALVIVVSEERGVVSVAEGGRLDEGVSSTDLTERLMQFWRQHSDSKSTVESSWWDKEPVRRAAVSVFLAAVLWLHFAYDPDTFHRAFEAPIELRNLPPTISLVESVPTNAEIILSGSEQAFQALEPEEITFSLDVSNLEAGENVLQLTESALDLPPELSLYDVDPEEVILHAREVEPVRARVVVPTTGDLPDTLELAALRVTPDTVTVMVPEDRPDGPVELSTEPVDLDEITGSTEVTLPLQVPSGIQLAPDQEGTVTVEVEVQERQVGFLIN